MDSIGQTLRKARQAKKMSVVEVARATNALSKQIEALEADKFDVFPAAIYAQGFIRLYAECVGLDPQPLLQAYRTGAAEGVAPAASAPAGAPACCLLPIWRRWRAACPLAPRLNRLAGRLTQAWRAASQRWPDFKARGRALSSLRLPVHTWQIIFSLVGLALLGLLVGLLIWWSAAWHKPVGISDSARWLQEPPAPYLNAE